MATAPARKFLFDTSFDPEDLRRDQLQAEAAAERERAAAEALALAEAAPPPEEPAPEPPAPTFSLEELQAASAQSYADGEQAGLAAARAAVEQQLAAALAHLPEQIATLLAAQRRSDDALAEQTVRVALTLARKLLPELARRHGLSEIEALIRRSLADMLEEPRIVVRVSDGLIEPIRDRLQPIADELGYPGALVLLVDPALGPADCRVEWADGGAERIADRLWQQIDAAVAGFFDYPQAVPAVADSSDTAPETGGSPAEAAADRPQS